MVKRFLKAGVIEDGKVEVKDEGTPQGGVISPLLANVYLLYMLIYGLKSDFGRAVRDTRD